MGNICGKTEPEPDAQAGRRLGSAPPPGPKTSRVPQKVGGPPRTLGGAGDESGGGDPTDARRRAAEAAEVRIIPPFSPYIYTCRAMRRCPCLISDMLTAFRRHAQKLPPKAESSSPSSMRKRRRTCRAPSPKQATRNCAPEKQTRPPMREIGISYRSRALRLTTNLTHLPNILTYKEAGNAILRVAGLQDASSPLFGVLFISF